MGRSNFHSNLKAEPCFYNRGSCFYSILDTCRKCFKYFICSFALLSHITFLVLVGFLIFCHLNNSGILTSGSDGETLQCAI